MKYFVSLFLSLFFLVFMSCGNEDNAWDNNIPIITLNEQSDSSGLLKSQITDIINYSKTRVRDKDCVKNRVKRAKIVRFTLC